MTTTKLHTVTADDVAALRGADSVTFHVHDGRGYIRAYLNTPMHRVLTRRQQQVFGEESPLPEQRMREITCEWLASGFGENGARSWSTDDASNMSAYANVSAGQISDGLWNTTATLITPGDVLTTVWCADNNTDVIRDAGLHSDRLTLRAENGKRERRFHVETSVGRDNSARMIRRDGR